MPDRGDDLIDRLYPKALVNHLSKLPEAANIPEAELHESIKGVTGPEDSRLNRLLTIIGAGAANEDVKREAHALYLSMHSREEEVLSEFPDKVAAFAESDRNQAADADDPRTLDYYLMHGITVTATAEQTARARSMCVNDRRNAPIIEKLKAERLLTINNFPGSRVMYLIHDILDHLWLFEFLRNTGIFTRYGDYLGSIDMNPATTFLFSRQSELLSTIGFGIRRWALAQSQGERLMTRDDDIVAILESSGDSRADGALRVYEGMGADNREWVRSVIENMAIQIADERRRWGAVKQRRGGGPTRSVTRLLDPLHLSLLIEATNAVQQCEIYPTVQLAALASVDDLLGRELLEAEGGAQFQLYVPRGVETVLAEADSAKIEWFRQHLDFSTSYHPITS